MKVEARLGLAKPGTSTLAFGSIVLDGCFVVDGISVMSSKKGPFVSFPSRKNAAGEYKDIAFPITKDFRKQIIDTVMNAYTDLAPF